MARIIGDPPEYAAENVMYQFAMNELPDYIGASFSAGVDFHLNRIEFDFLVFIPHMGVYAFEVKNSHANSGDIDRHYQNGIRQIKKQIYMIKDYFSSNYHINPYVGGLLCLPFISVNDLDNIGLPKDFDRNQVILKDDLINGISFLHRLTEYKSVMSFKTDYDDLSDLDAHYLLYYWDFPEVINALKNDCFNLPDMKKTPVPELPVSVYLSYDKDDCAIARAIEELLEDRGIKIRHSHFIDRLSESEPEERQNRIESCDSVLLLLSQAAQKNDTIKGEVETAFSLNKRIIPVWVDHEGADETMNEYFHKKLSHIQYKEMPKINNSTINEIVKTVKKPK